VFSRFRSTPEEDACTDVPSELGAFQERLGYFSRDRGLFTTALCHASYANENGLPDSNERLEFLGDSVLGMVTAHVLYETYPEESEGELTSHRMEFVCRDALARWAEALGLERVLKKGKSLKGAASPSLLADAVEAVLGAVYLDGGYEAAERVVRRYLFGAGTFLLGGGELDAKSRRQSRLQAEGQEKQEKNGLPRYEILSVTGPSHSPTFSVSVRVKGKTWLGKGQSRKAAELDAAAAALEDLENCTIL
jgi:ribonuclease-3